MAGERRDARLPAIELIGPADAGTRPRSAYRATHAREARSGRLAALMVDSIVLSVLVGVVNAVYGVTEVNGGYIAGNASVTTTTTAVAWPWLVLLTLAYFIVGEALFGATPGKQWMRLKVVRLDGGPVGVRDVLTRNILRLVDFLPVVYLLGGALVLGTTGAQRLGDLAAGTTVVYRHRALEPGATRTSGGAARRGLVAALAVAAAVTLLFDYFGRPPLVIDGLSKQGRLGPFDNGYTLGAPRWTLGQVTYPVTSPCRGSITLQFDWTGWQLAGTTVNLVTCRPS